MARMIVLWVSDPKVHPQLQMLVNQLKAKYEARGTADPMYFPNPVSIAEFDTEAPDYEEQLGRLKETVERDWS